MRPSRAAAGIVVTGTVLVVACIVALTVGVVLVAQQLPDPFEGQHEPPPVEYVPPALPREQPQTVAEKQAYIDTCVQMGGLPVVLAGPNGLSQGIGCAEPVGR